MEKPKTGIELIAEERQKQINKHGFTAQHSIKHPEFYDKNQLEQSALDVLSTPYKALLYFSWPENWDQVWYHKILKKARDNRKTST